MPDFKNLSPQQLQQIKDDLVERYQQFKSRGITLDITRGKPCTEQLDLSSGMLDAVNSRNYLTEEAVDCRNWAHGRGIEAIDC